MGEIFNVLLLQNTLRTATPVVLAALGCLMTQHVNITNIGIDGMMLIGAFFAVLGSYFCQSWLAGVLLALAVGMVLGLFYYLFVIKFHSDEFIIGVALNIFAGGLTVFLLRTIFKVKGSFTGPGIVPLPTVHIPGVSSIPVLGAAAQREYAAGVRELAAGANLLGVHLQNAAGLSFAGQRRISGCADRLWQNPGAHEVSGQRAVRHAQLPERARRRWTTAASKEQRQLFAAWEILLIKRQAFFSIIANGSKALFVKSIKKDRLVEMDYSHC